MNDDDLERLLADSFDRQARASVGDGVRPPRPRFLDAPAAHRRNRGRLLAPLAAAAAVVGLVVGITVVQGGGSSPQAHRTAAGNPPGPGGTASVPKTTGPHTPVHVKLLNSDGSTVGVGMPVIAYFSKRITDASALADATRLTVDGKPASGAWYFEKSAEPGYPLEGHFRMSAYWPAEAKIEVAMPIKGLSAGGKYAFDDSLTLAFSTGPEQVVTVDDTAHDLVLTRDGHEVERADVSLGAAKTPTLRGTKVVMDKGKDISMKSPGFFEAHVLWTERLTYGGEYLHAAPWNEKHIKEGIDSSNGCTNLMPADAKRLYRTLRIGDVVQFPNATGPRMSLADGYGDWDVSWPTWLTGGAVPTS